MLIEQVRGVFDDHGLRREQREHLQQIEREAVEALENLGKVAEKAGELPEIIVERIESWREKLDRARADHEYLDHQQHLRTVPTRAELEQRIEEILPQLKEMKRTVRAELEVLVGQIKAVPYRQFGSDKVVLRAKFELNLIGLLPAQVRAALAGVCNGPMARRFGTIPMLVDLFGPSTGPKYGLRALELAEQRLGLTAIGRALKITKRKANIAVQYGKALRQAGLTDPYIELIDPPVAASRWRTKRRADGQENDGQGEPDVARPHDDRPTSKE